MTKSPTQSPPPKRRMIESPSPPISLGPHPVRFLSLFVMLLRESVLFHITFHLLFKASITLGILKQSAIEWSYTYKPPNSSLTYTVQNTCSLDTNLQMIYFLWIRGYIPNAVIETDSLLLNAINDISTKDYNKARHDLIVGRSIPHKVKQNEDIESWDCEGDLKDSKPFLCLFKSNGPVRLTIGETVLRWEKMPLP